MIIMMGVAGAGKSVQAKLLAKKLGAKILAIGEILRSRLGGDQQEIMLSGKLIDDSIITSILEKEFSRLKSNEESILDGFPRTQAQAGWLLILRKNHKVHLTAVIHIITSESIAFERLIKRGRPDDHEAAIKERFLEYSRGILPVIESFESAGVPVLKINGEGSVDEVHGSIAGALETIK